jgi:addiction module HigA family antidote
MPPIPRPAHPGELIKAELAKWKHGTNMAWLATRVGMSRSALSRVVNGRTGVKARLAVCLAKVFKISAEKWLRMQAAYDLWYARRARQRNGKTQPFTAAVRITGRIQVLVHGTDAWRPGPLGLRRV